VWFGATYVTLTREDVHVESAWARLENASLHRIDLASELLAIGRGVSAVPPEALDRLTATLDHCAELVASPELLTAPDSAAAFEQAQAELALAVGDILDRYGARLDRRAPEAMERLRAQYDHVCTRVEEAQAQLDEAADRYNRTVTAFPHRAVAALLGFEGRVFADAGADMISVHVEVDPHLHRTLAVIRECGAKAGVVLNPSTPLDRVAEVLGCADFILLMSVNPGFGGQTLIPSVLDKARRLRAWIDRERLDCRIEIDGGVTEDNLEAVAATGVDMIVSGSAIFDTADPAATTRRMVHTLASAGLRGLRT
jgi:hypothetical protein